MKYLIAFDKFKGALPAGQVSALAAEAVRECRPEAEVSTAPLTDGGEGFATILAEVLGGRLIEREVPGPRFQPVPGKFALIEGARIPQPALARLKLPEKTAKELVGIVEMASASGYEKISPEERDPWKTTTLGTGMLMKAAVEAGAQALVLGIGGSATNDCGAGALEALGVLYYDRDLQPVSRITPEKFRLVTTVGSTSHLLDKFPPVRIACDVTNPLLGTRGATRIYGPQKGLREEDTERMERNMRKMATRLLGLFGRNPADWDKLMEEPGSGAAGGIGFALRHALPDSSFVEGFPLVSELLDLSNKVKAADLVITGEGCLDASSLTGKGPVSLIRMTHSSQPVLLLAGRVEREAVYALTASHSNLRILAISDPQWPLEKALRETPVALRKVLRETLADMD